jgi:HNH endonuclease
VDAASLSDPFDLAAWPIPPASPGRIYGTPDLDLWALVDSIDYAWAAQWTWSVLRRPGRQPYLRRQAGGTRRINPVNGIVERFPQPIFYLHVESMKRTGIPPPCPEHLLVDHIDVDSLNCTRQNLRWATYSINNRNRRGVTR